MLQFSCIYVVSVEYGNYCRSVTTVPRIVQPIRAEDAGGPCAALWKWSRLTRVFAAIKNAGWWVWIAEKWVGKMDVKCVGWGGVCCRIGSEGEELQTAVALPAAAEFSAEHVV